ncbi:MAG: chemotaxis-specific protein-glutamate methyltransferase CheB [Treponema sp.]|nr:chemotaxis-specific protein-glutamate methyltransferase CheB [Treponema sp.]
MGNIDTNYDTLSVMVCDDSALMRNLVSRIINEAPGMQVVGKAMNGKMLLDNLPNIKPDVVILDIEMPIMTGVEFLQERKKLKWDVPVIILSSIATKGAAVTMQCLELGASDFITKPGGSVTTEVATVSEELVEMIASYGGIYARRHGKRIPSSDHFVQAFKMHEAEKFVAAKKNIPISSTVDETSDHKVIPLPAFKPVGPKEPAVITPVRDGGRIKIIALGISTGGPNALRDVFKMIDPHLKQPILVVQHMPAGFTNEFAQSLNRICPLEVVEASDEMPIESGHIYIAPGNFHIKVEERVTGNVIRTTQEEQRNGHRPSADVLFESVAKIYKNNALGVIMTGMGKDGAVEITEMRKQGAYTLGQDEKSAIVYGMPRVAWELGGVQKQVPLMQMADEISKLAREKI